MYEVRWRVLRERLGGTLARVEQEHGDEECFRLAALALALLDRHKVDDKGRCRWCRSGHGWGRYFGRKQRCLVNAALSFYLKQRRDVVWRHMVAVR